MIAFPSIHLYKQIKDRNDYHGHTVWMHLNAPIDHFNKPLFLLIEDFYTTPPGRSHSNGRDVKAGRTKNGS